MVKSNRARYYSDAIVDTIKALGIQYAALNPGATFRGLHDSIVNYGQNQNPELILCCDEEYAVDIASGYARVAGKPMAAIVHNLVGLLHATMAIFNAWVDRTPVLVIGGGGPMDVERRRHWIDWIHTSPYQGSIVRDYVKWDEQPTSLPSAIDALIRGYRLANTPPRGPVYICFDAGLMEDKIEDVVLPDTSCYATSAPVAGHPPTMKTIAEMLVNAARPVVLADYLGREPGAVEALIELAELLSLPVIDCGNMFSFPNRHSLDLTGAEKELLSEADLVMALNVFDLAQALSANTMQAGSRPVCQKAKIIDVSLRHFATRSWVQDCGRLVPVDISVAADPGAAILSLVQICRELVARAPERGVFYQERREQLAARHDELRQVWQEEGDKEKDKRPISVARVFTELWEVIRDEDWVLTHHGISSWARRLWDWRKPYQYVGSRMGAGLGYGLGTSVGAALANRPWKRLCVDFQPDGDFLFNCSALWTAAHHRIPLLVVMYNNRSYYNSQGHEQAVARARGRPMKNARIGTRLENPHIDYAGIARSFGVHAEGPIEDPEDLHSAFARAVKYVKENNLPTLLDVVTQPR
ncbi:MAG: thiamine pyrophosphate-binding protein [Chloroflexi bacterium]|nr:thiamine pyrophosphate-binding protein [Chloroflexota bacterium]